MNLKVLGVVGLAVIGAALVAASGRGETNGIEVHVYKTATCGCCTQWVTHLEEEGFSVTAENVDNLPAVKQAAGIPSDLVSCHTAYIGDYVFEGHVPADAIREFLDEKPEGIIGLSVPGMPIGSPGMEGPNPQPYEVVAFDRDGNRAVFKVETP